MHDTFNPAPQQQWKNITLFLLTIAILVLCGVLIFPFLSAIVGAITIAVATDKPYRWLESKCRNRTLAAILAVLLITISIITPLFFLGEALVKQALTVVTLLRDTPPQQRIADLMSQHPGLAARIQSLGDQVDLAQATQKTASYLAGKLGSLLGNSFGAITQVVLMIFLLFFAYRDRTTAIRTLRSLLPLEESETDRVLATCNDTIYATAYGRLAISAVQGVLATAAYWALGLESAILWGMATVVGAMIPLVGALCVWAPIAIYLALTGHWGKAIILAVWGGLVVSTIDNYLYPVLVGRRIQQHTAVILLSVLGGVALFGIPGIILGPLLLSLAKTLLEIWTQRTNASPEGSE